MRSNLSINSRSRSPERTVRRMKTFSNLMQQSKKPMTSLQGISLERLVQLGGYGYLVLPGDYAPTKLKLPLCFAEIAHFLRQHGTNYGLPHRVLLFMSPFFFWFPGAHADIHNHTASYAQDIFSKSGDAKVSHRLYNSYATQLLSAEKDGVEICVRRPRADLPRDLKIRNPSRLRDLNTQVLSVASAFLGLLAGLPGGLLGSEALFDALANIHSARITRKQARPFKDSIGGASPTACAGARLITLSILALTNPMQLDLLCTVLGLCQLLIHETQRAADLKRQGLGISLARFRFVYGALDPDRLSCVLGPLMTNNVGSITQSDKSAKNKADKDTCAKGDDSVEQLGREIKSREIATLLVAYWPFVVRQLRGWGGVQYPLRCEKIAEFESDGTFA